MARRHYNLRGSKQPRRRLNDVDLERLHDDVEGHDERWPYYIAGGVTAVVVTFWLAAQAASLVHGFDWIPLGDGLVGAVHGLVNLRNNLTDPAAGWPAQLRGQVAPWWLFYPVLAGLVYLEVKYGRRAWSWWRERNEEDRGGTEWATERELDPIVNVKRNPKLSGGVVIGTTPKRHPIYLEPENHALVVAGTRSGKTAGLCIPALLTFPGVVIATSVKNDLLDKTIARREELGRVFVFDPTEGTEFPPEKMASWSPLDGSREWGGAQRTAAAIVGAGGIGSKGSGSSGNEEFFKAMSQQLLPVFLYAAAVMDEDMRRVLRWLHLIASKQTHAEVESILRWKNNLPALNAWTGFLNRQDPRLGENISASIQSALGAYEDEKVQRHSKRCDITPDTVFNGDANTVYVCAPASEQERLQPLFITLIQGLLKSVTNRSRPLETPLLVVLDEAANIAALPELPKLLSTIGGFNASIITAWQDFSQVKARYGDEMETILSNSRARLVLPGIADSTTLDYFAKVTGETVEQQVSVSGGKHGSSVSVGEGRRALLSPATIRQQRFGEAILVYGHLPPAKIKLRMWFEDRKLRTLAGESTAAGLIESLRERAAAVLNARLQKEPADTTLNTSGQNERRGIASGAKRALGPGEEAPPASARLDGTDAAPEFRRAASGQSQKR